MNYNKASSPLRTAFRSASNAVMSASITAMGFMGMSVAAKGVEHTINTLAADPVNGFTLMVGGMAAVAGVAGLVDPVAKLTSPVENATSRLTGAAVSAGIGAVIGGGLSLMGSGVGADIPQTMIQMAPAAGAAAGFVGIFGSVMHLGFRNVLLENHERRNSRGARGTDSFGTARRVGLITANGFNGMRLR